MPSRIIENILSGQKIGYAFLSRETEILQCNNLFMEYLSAEGPQTQSHVTRYLPELIGAETILKSIRDGGTPSLLLENINRLSPEGSITYLDVSVFPTGRPEMPLICLIRDVTANAMDRQKIQQQKYQIQVLKSQLRALGEFPSGELLGESEPIQKVRLMIERIACINTSTVLLRGETGTGKSVTARMIHQFCGKNSKGAFVEISCAAIPESLLESELFGYEKGAFTHATTSKKGLLEEADHGIIFLDEIGELPLTLQAKLLSFIETRTFRRLGSTRPVKVDIRIIAATNRNLEEMVQAGSFREDLFYRLNVLNIDLPPLRDMGRDVIHIANHFIKTLNSQFNKSVRKLSPAAEKVLLSQPWPGNIRELRNVVERAMIFANGDMLEVGDLQMASSGFRSSRSDVSAAPFQLPPGGMPFDEIEKSILSQALDMADQNQSGAARLLGMTRDAFRYRLEKYNLI